MFLTPKRHNCFCSVVVHTSAPAVRVSDTVNTPAPLYHTVNVLAVSSLVATALACTFFRLVPVRATPLAVVVHGAFNNAARLALEASAEPPINTLPAVVPIDETKVNVTP